MDKKKGGFGAVAEDIFSPETLQKAGKEEKKDKPAGKGNFKNDEDKRKHRITLCMTERLYSEITQKAEEKELSVNSYINFALKNAVKDM